MLGQLKMLPVRTCCPRGPFQQQYRAYALSRLSDRQVGTSRRRQQGRASPRPLIPVPQEEVPSEDVSQLWHTSQRPPNSNPEEGLRRLLLDNNTLMIERWAPLEWSGGCPDIGTFQTA